MATTGTQTVLDIVTDALLDIEAVQMGQSVPGKQGAHAMRVLNRLMKSWQRLEPTPDFLVASQSVTATTSAAHTLSPVRPIRILNANLKQTDGTEIPMIELSRDEYDELPDKDTTGIPTQFYYDRQKESAVFYVWPLFSSVTTETFEITYEREFEDISALTDTIDLPSEWYDVAVKQLAARLVHAYGSEAAKQTMPMEAEYALNRALASAVTGSVYFQRDRYA